MTSAARYNNRCWRVIESLHSALVTEAMEMSRISFAAELSVPRPAIVHTTDYGPRNLHNAISRLYHGVIVTAFYSGDSPRLGETACVRN